MLVFVIPLKSQKVSKSWDYVSKLVTRCLRSVCNQTSSNFQVIVVCHEKPNTNFVHPKLNYVEVDYPPPKITDYNAKRLDKVRKVATGLTLTKELETFYTMVIDADDCVSKNLAEFVSKHAKCNGWFVNMGYRYDDGSKRILSVQKNFYKLCASSIIVRHDLYKLPKKFEYDPSEYHSLVQTQIHHAKVPENMESKGKSFEPLPFAGAVYVTPANGDNLFAQRSFSNKLRENPRMILSPVKKALLYTLNSQSLTDSIRDEFGLYNINFS